MAAFQAERSSGLPSNGCSQDIAAGRIDIVVVYKVDRLTRSLLDFAKLVEAFDKAGTSFVSITQSFNTTTSMGRLTLNMLLSFAQFEREVTAERIRDKIAQSKAKGMWMGGTRRSAIGRRDAASPSLRKMRRSSAASSARYLELGNVRLLAAELEESGIRSPARKATTGRAFGGRPFSRGHLYRILSNPIYIARIDHGGRSHRGQSSADHRARALGPGAGDPCRQQERGPRRRARRGQPARWKAGRRSRRADGRHARLQRQGSLSLLCQPRLASLR